MTEPLDSFLHRESKSNNIDHWDSADWSHISGKFNDFDCENWSNVSDLGWTSQSLLNDDSPIEDNDFSIVQDSALAKLDLQLTESERKLIDEFYEEMEGVRESLYNSSTNYTESALKRIKWITDKYLKEGIRLNSRDDDRDETVTNFIFEEMVGVLDSVVYVNSSTVAPERSNSSNNESQDYDDTDEISSNSLDIIKNVASNLLLKGGKVRRDLFYHGRICNYCIYG